MITKAEVRPIHVWIPDFQNSQKIYCAILAAYKFYNVGK